MTTPALAINIVYAPPLLPDELLYSWLARLALLNAMGSPRECLAKIYGSDTVIPVIDLPSKLNKLQQRLKDWLPFYTLEEMIESSTLLPYHRPFLTAERYASAYQTMVYGSGMGLKTQIGRVANRFGAAPFLRWCPKCMKDSLTRMGSAYSMRRHQLPGVNCCPIHGIFLQYVQSDANMYRQKFAQPSGWYNAKPRAQTDETQKKFAHISAELLAANLPALDAEQRAATYQHAVLSLGLMSKSGRIDYQGLVCAVRARFNDFGGFEHQQRLLAPSSQPLGWLRDLIQRPERSVHPICHLLLIEYLFGSVAGFQNAYASASHFHLPDDASLTSSVTCRSISSNPYSEKVLLDTSLSCRQAAKLIGKSVTSIVSQRRQLGIPVQNRFKTLNPILFEEIKASLRTEDSLSDIANLYGVSLSTLYRILAVHPSLTRTRKIKRNKREKFVRRQRWSATLKAHKNSGVSAARAESEADYIWLYRNDHTWLVSTTRELVRPKNSIHRVDWEKRDAELTKKMLMNLQVLKSNNPFKRITITSLIRPLGEKSVRRNLWHLPILHGHLQQATESFEEFRTRRVNFAIETAICNKLSLKIWRIKRLAGLRLWSNSLTEYTYNKITQLNAQNSLSPDSLSR